MSGFLKRNQVTTNLSSQTNKSIFADYFEGRTVPGEAEVSHLQLLVVNGGGEQQYLELKDEEVKRLYSLLKKAFEAPKQSPKMPGFKDVTVNVVTPNDIPEEIERELFKAIKNMGGI